MKDLKLKISLKNNQDKMKKDFNHPIKTNHVYFEKKTDTVYLNIEREKWFPINFQWIPVVNLNNELNTKNK